MIPQGLVPVPHIVASSLVYHVEGWAKELSGLFDEGPVPVLHMMACSLFYHTEEWVKELSSLFDEVLISLLKALPFLPNHILKAHIFLLRP